MGSCKVASLESVSKLRDFGRYSLSLRLSFKHLVWKYPLSFRDEFFYSRFFFAE